MPVYIYMKIGDGPTPDIKGDATATGHVDWIELASADYSTRRPASGESNDNVMSEVVAVKFQDRSSVELLRRSVERDGNGYGIQIDFVRVTGTATNYRTVKLSGAFIADYKVSRTSSDRGYTETLTFTTRKLEWGSAASVTPHTSDVGWSSLA